MYLWMGIVYTGRGCRRFSRRVDARRDFTSPAWSDCCAPGGLVGAVGHPFLLFEAQMEQNQMEDYLSDEEDSGVMPNPQTPAPSRGGSLVERTDSEPETDGPSAPRCAICFRADHGSLIYVVTPHSMSLLRSSLCWWAMQCSHALCEKWHVGRNRQ